MKTLTKVLLLFGVFARLSTAQVILTNTTTTANIGTGIGSNTGVSCFPVTSTTGMAAPAFTNPNLPTGNQTVLYIDKEAMFVTSVPASTNVCVTRGFASTVATGHLSGATVWIASPSQLTFNEKAGYCVATNEPFMPVINTVTGHIFSCPTAGQWIQVQNGTQTPSPAQTISFLCSGTVGSAETEYVSSTVACSGSTTQLLRWTATTAGTVSNLRVSSTGNFLGTGGSIFTVLKNGTAVTGFTCAPTAATKVCASMSSGFTSSGTVGAVNSVTVAAGDTIDVSFLSATSDTAANLSVQLSVY